MTKTPERAIREVQYHDIPDDPIIREYLDWIYDWATHDRVPPSLACHKLIERLFQAEFFHTVKWDENRERDGKGLRFRFAQATDLASRMNMSPSGLTAYIDRVMGYCSLLEVMVVLACRMEEDYMDNPQMGDRSTCWFTDMLLSMQLGHVPDIWYEQERIDKAIHITLNRLYEYNGRGGLFHIRNADRDMRDVELWGQMLEYARRMY